MRIWQLLRLCTGLRYIQGCAEHDDFTAPLPEWCSSVSRQLL